MVRTMTAAGAVPHFHFHDDVNMTQLVQLRRELQLYPKAGKVTMLPFIIKVQDSPAQFPHSSPLQRAVCCCQHLFTGQCSVNALAAGAEFFDA